MSGNDAGYDEGIGSLSGLKKPDCISCDPLDKRILLYARPYFGFAGPFMWPMMKLIDEFRRGWNGISQPSLLFAIGFAASCVALATAARWCLSLIRPDVFFTPYIPAVFFATAFGGFRIGVATALVGGALGATVDFSNTLPDFARLALLAIYLMVCGIMIWGIEHFRSLASHQREIAKRLIQEEEYRKLGGEQ